MHYYFDYEEPVFRPPSEAHSLILQATIGCSQNTCGFCGMYKMKHFRLRSVAEVLAEVALIPVRRREQIQRVFLADGDALVYPQQGLVEMLDRLAQVLPALMRVGIYASPNSLTTKTVEELALLRQKMLRIIYFGLESGDGPTLELVRKGYAPERMLELCTRAKQAGIKISVTAILGLAGRARTAEHAQATADWITALSPEYFSLLTMFRRHNAAYFDDIAPLTNGEIIQEALAVVRRLNPTRTILRSNHVSNILNLEGSYPKDRDRIIAQAESALIQARRHPQWFDSIPDYGEAYY